MQRLFDERLIAMFYWSYKWLDGDMRMLVGLVEVFLAVLGVWFHRVLTRLPTSRAHFSVLVCELECLNKSQCLVYGAAHRKVVDGDLTQVTFVVNDEQTTESNTIIFDQHPIPACNIPALVSKQWDLHVSKASLFAWCVDPGEMREVRVCRASHHLTVDSFELLRPVTERNQLGRANKRKVEWVEEED